MSYGMQWFQVQCPQCCAALQTKLPAGVTSVQCSQCKTVFTVEVDASWMPDRQELELNRRARRSKQQKTDRCRTPTMKLYNDFMREEMARLRRERPELRGKEHHTTTFRMAASNWRQAPVNPKNAPAEDGTAAASSGNGNCGPAFA